MFAVVQAAFYERIDREARRVATAVGEDTAFLAEKKKVKNAMNCQELRAALSHRDKVKSGVKAELIDRLLAAVFEEYAVKVRPGIVAGNDTVKIRLSAAAAAANQSAAATAMAAAAAVGLSVAALDAAKKRAVNKEKNATLAARAAKHSKVAAAASVACMTGLPAAVVTCRAAAHSRAMVVLRTILPESDAVESLGGALGNPILLEEVGLPPILCDVVCCKC